MPLNATNPGLSGGTVLSSVIYAFLGVILMLLAYRLFDAIHPVNFNEELKRGNVAAGLTVAGILIGIAIIIAAAIL